ncbi:glycosyltransferase family 4 protein [Arthrobacter cryoconiti]|uniref:D-inositol 3-phosphate glycosyltransferase n=1 Tax=Arthrobacter cryoconiti TaxID=748907 RepID=A0ABV8R0S8_9MICC|nr:glycosyltransferase family 1 protein [Arthrobacter cryoconiti]MCC9068545.1 glycosyltransferase family 1 protein [Arthrobacter cryoconiti]
MKVAIVAESFLPEMNGVTHSLLKILQHLKLRGDQVLVIAPSTLELAPDIVEGATIVRVTAVPIVGYRNVRIAMGGVARIRTILAEFEPDVVHLASPFVLGWRGVRAAAVLNLPSVAIYQTDVPGYAGKYGMPFFESWAWTRVERIHQAATKTLAPSTDSVNQLRGHGIPRVELWGRGVDISRFHPDKRSSDFRTMVAPGGQQIIGYVGRLALEKQLLDLTALTAIPNTRLVIVGDGPQRSALETALPDAHFTGFLHGEELATAMASLDLFVHPGELETFCQSIQEAMASGVPVVATGSGGPLDLVDSSRTGWLYQPGELGQMRSYVQDLLGDPAKRAAFGAAAFAKVQSRTWNTVCDDLVNHYLAAMNEHTAALTGWETNS